MKSAKVNGSTMFSLPDLPGEVLAIIGGYLDGSTLSILVSIDPRLLPSIALCTKHLRLPVVTPHSRTLLSHGGTFVRSMDLSNCYSESTDIGSVILMCPSIKELNVVNCNISLQTLRTVITSFAQLEILSFSYLGAIENIAALVQEEKTGFRVVSPIRQLYVELNPTWSAKTYFPRLLDQFSTLERLHVHLIEYFRPPAASDVHLAAPPQCERWRHLRTVIVTSCEGAEVCVPVLLDHLFSARLKRDHLDHWQDESLASYIYEDGIFNGENPPDLLDGEGSVLRDAYHIRFKGEPVVFPWGNPRGLKLSCGLPHIALRAKNFFTEPCTWASDLVELDLTDCLSDVPVGNWSNIIENSPALEALGIPYCFFPAQTDFLESPPPMKRSIGWRRSFFEILRKMKLRRLFISGECPHRNKLPYSSPLTIRNYSVVRDLPYLEELTLHEVYVTPGLFRSVNNDKLRIARFALRGGDSMSAVEEFIGKCVELKYFKLEMTGLRLGSRELWEALAQCRSLEQICLGTFLKSDIKLAAIAEFLPQIIDRIRVFHIHADKARNRNFLFDVMRKFLKLYRRKNPYRDVHFEAESLTSPWRKVNPPFYAGRALCCVSNNIGKIKPIGWDLPLTRP